MPKTIWMPGAWNGQKGGGKRQSVFLPEEVHRLVKDAEARGRYQANLAYATEPLRKALVAPPMDPQPTSPLAALLVTGGAMFLFGFVVAWAVLL